MSTVICFFCRAPIVLARSHSPGRCRGQLRALEAADESVAQPAGTPQTYLEAVRAGLRGGIIKVNEQRAP